MKKLLLNLIICMSIALVGCGGLCDTKDLNADSYERLNKEILFNDGWTFSLGEIDSPYTNPKCDYDGWQDVMIPHDWSIESGYTQENTAGSNGFLPGGVGWYRKEFSLPKGWADDGVSVRFEGVYNNSHVWINGHNLGFFANGYLDFEYDLTPYLDKNGKNTIVVRVDRRAYADARWYVGAGIYRPVHLISREYVYIPTHGQLISTPKVSAEEAQVKVVTDYTNRTESPQEITVEYKLAFGETIQLTDSSVLKLGAGESVSDEKLLQITNPTLWDLDNTACYDLYTFVKSNGKVVDCFKESFGVREFEFNPSKGFLLNGKSVKIKGVNIHHDLGSVGVALYNEELRNRLESLKSVGVNAIRTAHNPHSESLLKMCDELGLLVMDEFTDEWVIMKDKWIIQRSKSKIPDHLESGYPNYFKEFAERDLKNFIRRDYNHPSVIMWSIGNEIEWTYKYYFASSLDKKGYKGLVFTGEPEKNRELTLKRFTELSKGKDELSETAHKLAGWVKDVDTSRPVTSGVVIPSVSRISGYTDALDVVGYNYKDSYYAIDHEMYPEKSIIGSENVGQYFEWAAVADKDYIPGIFLWTGVDYLGENGPWPAKGGTYSLFDFACFKTSRGHFFETLWLDVPKTHVVTTAASMSEFKLQKDGSFETVLRKDPLRRWLWFETFDKWNYKKGEDVVVQVYTNAPKVELLLNGKSLGTKLRADFAEENIILWQIPYVEGELIAIGRDANGGEVSRHSLRTPEAASQLSLKNGQNALSAMDDSFRVEVELQDENGTLIVDVPATITADYDSSLRIVGVDNGSDKFVGDHQASSIETYNGRALFIFAKSEMTRRGVKSVTFTTNVDGVKISAKTGVTLK